MCVRAGGVDFWVAVDDSVCRRACVRACVCVCVCVCVCLVVVVFVVGVCSVIHCGLMAVPCNRNIPTAGHTY